MKILAAAMLAGACVCLVAMVYFAERQHVVGIPVAATPPLQQKTQSPVYSWVAARDETRALNVAQMYALSGFPPATRPMRIEVTASQPVNVGFLPTDWQQRLITEPGLLDANWNRADCSEKGILHSTIDCTITGERGKSFFIQDARHPLDVVGAMVLHQLTGLTNKGADQSANTVRLVLSNRQCVQNCDQQH